ncbi:MAG: hypothetical protein JSR85_08680 [Proteobacteria bacterium]|nr:hypothetical protein [Pseudomonadota bacterium]
MRKKILQTAVFSSFLLAIKASTGYAQTPPSGNYQASCPWYEMQPDTDTLWGQCYNSNNEEKLSSLQNALQCGNINNCNGALTCGNCPSTQNESKHHN